MEGKKPAKFYMLSSQSFRKNTHLNNEGLLAITGQTTILLSSQNTMEFT